MKFWKCLFLVNIILWSFCEVDRFSTWNSFFLESCSTTHHHQVQVNYDCTALNKVRHLSCPCVFAVALTIESILTRMVLDHWALFLFFLPVSYRRECPFSNFGSLLTTCPEYPSMRVLIRTLSLIDFFKRCAIQDIWAFFARPTFGKTSILSLMSVAYKKTEKTSDHISLFFVIFLLLRLPYSVHSNSI